jgi:hypothetical protein
VRDAAKLFPKQAILPKMPERRRSWLEKARQMLHRLRHKVTA